MSNPDYESPPVGHLISAVVHDIPEDVIIDNDRLHSVLLRAIEEDGFTVLQVARHDFAPRGLTSMVLLGESHAAIHTYPEHRSLAFELYSCLGEGHGRNSFKKFLELVPHGEIDFSENAVVVKKRDQSEKKQGKSRHIGVGRARRQLRVVS